MNNSLKTGLVMIVFLAVMFGAAIVLERAQEQVIDNVTREQLEAGRLIRCDSAQACGVLVGADGNHWMHLPQGIYPVVDTPDNPFDERYWTTRYIPVRFTPGCWHLDFDLKFDGTQSPVAYRESSAKCEGK